MKWNQIRCFRNRGVEVKVVPWNYDFNAEAEPFDGLFVSNGPGDPSMVKETIANLSKALEASKVRSSVSVSVTSCLRSRQARRPAR